MAFRVGPFLVGWQRLINDTPFGFHTHFVVAVAVVALLLLSNVIVHPSVGSSVIRILTRPHWQVSVSFFLHSSHSYFHFFLAHIYAQNLLPYSPLWPLPPLLAYFMHVCTCVGWCISREAIKPCNGTLGADLLPLSA